VPRKPTNDNDRSFRVIRPPAPRRTGIHLYKVGQSVHFSAANIDRGAAGIYRIVAHLPDSFGEQQYRIKSTTSPQERVVMESQLSAIDG
jgi:hypothetical protein